MGLEDLNKKRDALIERLDEYIRLDECIRFDSIQDVYGADKARKELETLKNHIYSIAIIGEGKAGKSTFINALLEEEILPTDILQSTSAIIEIKYSPEKYLKISFADKKIKDTRKDSEDSEWVDSNIDYLLIKYAAVNRKYQFLPTTVIDELLANREILKSDLEESGHLDECLKKIAEKSGNNRIRECQNDIKEYIKIREISDIPINVELGYPLTKWDNIWLVDTPGVNAIGNFGAKTDEFLKNASAVVFIKPIKPVESKSFREFYENNTKRIQERTLLVLTHRALSTEDEVAELSGAWEEIYKGSNIVVIDSRLKCIEEKLSQGITREKIFQNAADKKLLADYWLDAENDLEKFKYLIKKASNFNELEDKLAVFCQEVPWKMMKSICENIKNAYEDKINLLEWVKSLENDEDLHTFKKTIYAYHQELDQLNQLIQGIENELKQKYGGTDSTFQKKINDLYNDLIKNLNNVSKFHDISRHLQNFLDGCNQLIIDLHERATTECNEKLKKFNKEVKVPIPNKIVFNIDTDLDQIKKGFEIPRHSFELGTIKYGEVKKKFHESAAIQDARQNIQRKAALKLLDAPSISLKIIELVSKEFKDTIKNIQKDREQKLDDQEKEKKNKEKNLNIIKQNEKYMKEFYEEIKSLKPLWEELNATS